MLGNNTVKARLFHNGSPVAWCEANFVGLLGMQVNSGPLAYPKGTRLEVELTVENQYGTNQCILPAAVTSHSNGEMGLTFLNHDMNSNSVLTEVIMSMGVHAAASSS